MSEDHAMSAKKLAAAPKAKATGPAASLLRYDGSGPIEVTGSDGIYERHLAFDNVVKLSKANARERFEAFARSERDILSQRWVQTVDTYEREKPKRLYYLSMEFHWPLVGQQLDESPARFGGQASRRAEKARLAGRSPDERSRPCGRQLALAIGFGHTVSAALQ